MYINSYSNNQPNFCGLKDLSKMKNLPKLLLGQIMEVGVTTTPSHIGDVYFRTSISEKLRNPQAALLDECSALALQNQLNFFQKGLLNNGYYGYKKPIQGDTQALKNKLNAEFKTLRKTTKNQMLYRGITNLSDKDYQKFKNYKVGEQVIPDEGFAYFTQNQNSAIDYTRDLRTKAKIKNSVMFHVKVPKDSQVSELKGVVPSKGTVPFEYKEETVLPAGSIYEVVKPSELDKDGTLQVFLKFLNKF